MLQYSKNLGIWNSIGSFNILGILQKNTPSFLNIVLCLFSLPLSASPVPSAPELWVKASEVQMIIHLW